MAEKFIPEIDGILRRHMIRVPNEIDKASGIRIFGKLIRSIVFTTDVAVIRNCNANAVIAVYPFTPQPIISHSIITCSDVPVFCGVGGGTTTGHRVVNLAEHAEYQGAVGVVLNAPTCNETIEFLKECIEIPIVLTVVSEKTDIKKRLESGVSIFNVSAASRTPEIVRNIRKDYPDVPIMATGGPTPDSILETIEAGANAITYTPPSTSDIFKGLMNKYREQH
ncbi:MAG: hydrolase [Clostridiales bacterium]|nr:hydrolase [Clostridiales bacterium]